MSLSDLASLGNLIAGFAVLVSLIFLYFQQLNQQVLQTERNQRSVIQTGRATRLIDTLYRRLDPHLLDVTFRGNKGDTSMPPDEIHAYLQMSYATFLAFEDTWLQARAGTIDPDAWETAVGRLKRILAIPGVRVAWKTWRLSFGDGFAKAIDQIVAEARSSNWKELSTSWVSDVAEETRLISAK
jgi:hypothetical protein